MVSTALQKTVFLVSVTVFTTFSLNFLKSLITIANSGEKQLTHGRGLAISDWVGDRAVNYTLTNQTCPFEERKALQAALLMAYVGFG